MLRLRGVSFTWRDGQLHDGARHMGMIAQEVEGVFPEWVRTDPEGYKSLAYEGFEALTVEAMRELEQENRELKDRIDQLEARLERVVSLMENPDGVPGATVRANDLDDVQDDSQGTGTTCGIAPQGSTPGGIVLLSLLGLLVVLSRKRARR